MAIFIKTFSYTIALRSGASRTACIFGSNRAFAGGSALTRSGAANLGQSRPNNGMANPDVRAKVHKALALARLKNKSRKSQNTA